MMKSKTLVIVLAIAAASVGGAYLALSKGRSAWEKVVRGEPFLPTITDLAPKLVKIELMRGKDRRELRKVGDAKDGSAWTLVTSDGYPVRFEEVKGLVAGLSSLKADDRMTAKKERHGELALAWTNETPDESGRGARVRLFTSTDEGATPEVDIVLGEERANPRAQFVRRFSEDQCWRVLGSVLVDIEPRRWVEAELLSIPDGEVRGVTFNGLTLVGTEGADGRVTYAAVEPASPAVPLAAPDTPSDFVWTDARKEVAIRTLPNWLSRLELDDVRRAKGGTPDSALSASFDMVRGTLKVNAVRDGDSVWISFEAAPKEGAPSADEINAKKKYPGDPYIPDWKAFAAKHAGWEYKLPGWKLNSLEEAAKVAEEGDSAEPADPNQPTRIPSARD
jgi:hypothetical protein